jgi:hypothetical protein
MKTIWKYQIPVADTFHLMMPEGAQVLTVQMQGGVPTLWCVVEPDAPQEQRWFEMRGTGHLVGEVGDYIATIQLHGGALVFHVFNDAQPQGDRS